MFCSLTRTLLLSSFFTHANVVNGHELEDPTAIKIAPQDPLAEQEPPNLVVDFLTKSQSALHIPLIIGLIIYQFYYNKKNPAVAFEADEIAEVRLFASKDIWLRCKIVGPAEKKESYNIQILDIDSHEDAKQFEGKTIPATIGSLRKMQDQCKEQKKDD
eukprot:gnl/MRDRNA2_/MRDRNA2_100855_c0_seq1.p1 gnl/MRDRNA2_/MRDRNA2_100855_c0~~gnl/MRDRNA2_/MRDRNA2_100855_c0_seq1.p1  ORF type:complete len:159 (+),score=25.45 gnl/MRDRNA2_/MRDRNA2_100855_c0_seq1:96-572(+)